MKFFILFYFDLWTFVDSIVGSSTSPAAISQAVSELEQALEADDYSALGTAAANAVSKHAVDPATGALAALQALRAVLGLDALQRRAQGDFDGPPPCWCVDDTVCAWHDGEPVAVDLTVEFIQDLSKYYDGVLLPLLEEMK